MVSSIAPYRSAPSVAAPRRQAPSQWDDGAELSEASWARQVPDRLILELCELPGPTVVHEIDTLQSEIGSLL